MNDAIVSRALVKRYGRHNALDGFTLAVPAGSITGLVGRNGAGKTTWMVSVAGFILPDSGEISILGSGPFDARRHGGKFTILPQDSDLPNEGRVRSLLLHYARLQGLSAAKAASSADSLIDAFNLKDKANSPIRSLSHGMRKRVMVAQAFLGEPEVVMLDEPLSGLDPVEADRLRSFILVAFVADGKVERMETMRSLTSDSGRIAYTLKSMPADLAALESACPGVSLSSDGASLVARFGESLAVADVNAALLPRLVGFGVIAVVPGRSLEEAYLNQVR